MITIVSSSAYEEKLRAAKRLERKKKARCFVRFWDAAGKKFSAVVKFSTTSSAARFVEKYEYAGDVRQFTADICGNACPAFRVLPDRHEERVYPNGKCSLSTFKWLFNAILYRNGTHQRKEEYS